RVAGAVVEAGVPRRAVRAAAALDTSAAAPRRCRALRRVCEERGHGGVISALGDVAGDARDAAREVGQGGNWTAARGAARYADRGAGPRIAEERGHEVVAAAACTVRSAAGLADRRRGARHGIRDQRTRPPVAGHRAGVLVLAGSACGPAGSERLGGARGQPCALLGDGGGAAEERLVGRYGHAGEGGEIGDGRASNACEAYSDVLGGVDEAIAITAVEIRTEPGAP